MYKRLALNVLIILLPNFLYAQDSQLAARMALEEAVKRSDIYNASDVEGFILSLDTLETRNGKEIEHNQLRAKVIKDEALSKMMVRYTDPPGIKGTTYLVYMNIQEKKPEGIWLYLPSFKKTQRITPYKAKKSLPKAISSLSIFNAREIDFDDYAFSEKQDNNQGEKRELMIEMNPNSKNTKSHFIVWIEKERGLITKVAKKDSQERTIEQVEFQDYKPYGAYWLPTEIFTHDISTERTTKVVIKQLELSAVLKASDFELEAMQNPF